MTARSIAGLGHEASHSSLVNARAGDRVLRIILIGGVLLRVVVYVFLRFRNNDPHLAVIEFIADNLSIPISGQLGQASHPPLYYLLAAPLSVLGPPKLVQGFSLLLSISNLWLLYLLIRDTALLRSSQARRHALMFVALLPQFVFFSSFVSNDPLAFLVGTLIVFQAFRYMDRPTRKNLLLLASVLGTGLLTKGTLLAFVPVILAMVIVVQLRQEARAREFLLALGLFVSVCLAIGSFKYVQNIAHFGKPFVSRSELGFEWVARQQGTYQGLPSIIDVNVVKLALHPTVGEHTQHSLPLLLYGTFWYSHIPESNLNATRRYPLSLVPTAIYMLAVVPTLLMLVGAGRCAWRNRSPRATLAGTDSFISERLREALILLLLSSNLTLVLVWGLMHDAWSFFQARLLFAAFFSIALLIGMGFETVYNWKPALGRKLNASLFLLYLVFGLYFLAEFGASVGRVLLG